MGNRDSLGLVDWWGTGAGFVGQKFGGVWLGGRRGGRCNWEVEAVGMSTVGDGGDMRVGGFEQVEDIAAVVLVLVCVV